MYDYSPQTCLIKDIDGKLYNIIDLWNGIKVPVDLSTLRYSYAPKSCLVKNVDGTDVNIIDTILSVANGSTGGSSSYQEIVNARGKYSTLGERLDKENEKIYDTLNAKDFLPFEGQNVTVEHSKVGYTKDMQVGGRTYQNLIPRPVTREYTANNTMYIIPTVPFRLNIVYSIVITVRSNTLSVPFVLSGYSLAGSGAGTPLPSTDVTGDNPIYNTGETGQKVITFGYSTVSNESNMKLAFFNQGTATGKIDFDLMVLEGDYKNKEIPHYFEGIKSVGEAEENKISILSSTSNLAESFKETVHLTRNTPTEYKKINATLKGVYYQGLVKDGEFIVPSGSTIINFYDENKTKIEWLTLNGKPREFDWGDILLKARYYTIFNSADDLVFDDVFIGKTPNYSISKIDKKEILLPFEGGLKGLQNGAKDTFVIKEDGLYVRQKVGKLVLNGKENWQEITSRPNTNTIYVQINLKSPNANVICDKILPQTGDYLWNNDEEGIGTNRSTNLQLRVLRSKLETQDVEGFKKWLQTNPITIYYELAEPIEHKIANLNSINLETYKDITYITSDNEIKPKLTFKAPCDVPAVISTLNSRNIRLQNEVDNKTTQLQEKDRQLEEAHSNQIAKDLDLDFRLFEIEMSTPALIKMSRMRVGSNILSPYDLMKHCIEKGLYEVLDMEYKINRYLTGGKITKEQSIELLGLINKGEA